MKRWRWVAVLFLLVVAQTAPAFAPTALATSKGDGCVQGGDSSGAHQSSGGYLCLSLLVHLTGTNVPTSGLTVSVIRQKPNYYADNSFTLQNRAQLQASPPNYYALGYVDYQANKKFTDDTTYTSYFGIAGTGNNLSCSGDPSSISYNDVVAEFTFNITVSGPGLIAPATITKNFCTAANNREEINLPVSTTGNPTGTGGFTMTPTYRDDISGAKGICAAGSFMDVYGGPDNLREGSSSAPQWQLKPDGKGAFTSPLAYKPGIYNVSLICHANSGSNARGYIANGTVTIVANKQIVATPLVATLDGFDAQPLPPDPEPPTCKLDPVTWLVCPAIALVNKVANAIFKDAVIPLLKTTAVDDTNPLKPLWQALVYLSDIFFVVIFLLLIFGESFGLENYSIKRILPRLIAAAVLMQFSYLLGGLIIDLGNIGGAGIQGLLASIPGVPGKDTASNVSAVGGVVDGLLAVTAIAVIGIGIVGFAAVAIIVAVFGILVTLVFRQILLAVLVVAAPLAFAAWILPSTEKYFKMWLKNLTRISLMYPMIVLIFGVAGILAKTGITAADISAAGTGGTTAKTAGLVTKAVLSLMPVFALLAIPATFKASGVLMARVGNLIAGRSSGAAGSALKAGKKSAVITKDNRLTKLAAKGADPNSRVPGVVGRISRLGAFGIGGVVGSKSNARVYAAQAKLEKEQREGFERKYDSATSAVLIVAAASGNAVERKVAITELAKQNDVGALETILTRQYSGDPGNREWREAIAPQASSLLTRAPHLVASNQVNGKTYTIYRRVLNATTRQYEGGISAETMAGLHKGSWATLVAVAQEAKRTGDVETLRFIKAQLAHLRAVPALAAKLGKDGQFYALQIDAL